MKIESIIASKKKNEYQVTVSCNDLPELNMHMHKEIIKCLFSIAMARYPFLKGFVLGTSDKKPTGLLTTAEAKKQHNEKYGTDFILWYRLYLKKMSDD